MTPPNRRNRFSRRQFIHAAAYGAFASSMTRGTNASDRGVFAAAPTSENEAVNAPTDTAAGDLIDAHVHVWTPDLEKYPLAKGFSKTDMKPASFTAEELFAHARPAGVRRVVLIQMSYYGFDNAYMLDTMARYNRDKPRSVFSGVAIVDSTSGRVDEEMRRLKKLGVRGFRIQPHGEKPDRWLASDGMKAMWKCGAAERLAMCHLINPEFLPSVDRMCERFPDTPAVIDHFARVGIDGTIREDDVKNLCRLARHKQVAVKVSAFYALGKKKAPYADLIPMARRLLDAFGPDRLMWASDAPFQVQDGHKYQDSVALVRDRFDFLGREDRARLLRTTAERAFFA